MASQVRTIFVVYAVWSLYIVTVKCDKCYFGQHSSAPGDSCYHILKIQPECYENSGFYWVKKGTGVEYVYCDMEHNGGGWRRAIYFHSNLNMTCPGDLVSENLYNTTRTYCKRNPTELLFNSFTWNTDEQVQFSEIRGYASLRVASGTAPKAFHYYTKTLPEFGIVDGLDIVIGVFPGGWVKPVFAYAVGLVNSGSNSCPVSGGDEYGDFRRNYRDYAYACDEIDAVGYIDSEGIYSHELFAGSSCVQCPVGMPWFERSFGDTIQDAKIQVRMINADEHNDDTIYLADMELFVR